MEYSGSFHGMYGDAVVFGSGVDQYLFVGFGTFSRSLWRNVCSFENTRAGDAVFCSGVNRSICLLNLVYL